MTGSKYAVAMDHLEDHKALHMDAHMFSMKTKDEHTDIITAITTQL